MAGRDDRTDVVNGIILMQKFERTMEVVTRVREAVQKLNTDGTLPNGVQIVPSTTAAISCDPVHTGCTTCCSASADLLIQWLFPRQSAHRDHVAATIPVALFLAVIIHRVAG